MQLLYKFSPPAAASRAKQGIYELLVIRKDYFYSHSLGRYHSHQEQCHRGTAIHRTFDLKFLRSSIDTTDEGDLGNVQFMFKQRINHLNHSLNCHSFFGHNQTAVRVSGTSFRFKSFALESIEAMSILNIKSSNTTYNN